MELNGEGIILTSCSTLSLSTIYFTEVINPFLNSIACSLLEPLIIGQRGVLSKAEVSVSQRAIAGANYHTLLKRSRCNNARTSLTMSNQRLLRGHTRFQSSQTAEYLHSLHQATLTTTPAIGIPEVPSTSYTRRVSKALEEQRSNMDRKRV